MPFFAETPVKRNMSKEEIIEVIGMLTDVLENMNLEINGLKTETKDRFESIGNHMPGNAKYSDAVTYGRKTVILRTSMIKGIRMKEFNNYVKNRYSKLRPFPETTVT